MANLKSLVLEPEITENFHPNDLGKIMHLPYNPAGQMSTQAMALRNIGVPTSFCSYATSRYKYPTDIPSPVSKIPINKRENVMIQFAKENAKNFDILHFHGGQTFTGFLNSDLNFLKSNGNKMIMTYWGSEARRLSIAKQKNPYAIVKIQDEKLLLQRLKKVSQYIDTVIVPDYEMLEYVYGYFKKIYIIGISVDPLSISPIYPDVAKKKPIIIHAPSDRNIKGTEFINQAIENLKKTTDFEYIIVENMRNAQALELYKKADIIIDQIRMGIYATFAIESMLLGKPVIAYIREDLKEKYPSDLPIISANPITVEETLRELIHNSKLRHELGVKGRLYAEKYHNPERIARQLITVYKDL
ncbi:hypothetical protein [Priestia megaterium]|uniref:hypothetical protein n=1 Tax=Priestia megaterium TaxID=1404 RepID=UPI00398FA5AF